jgi:hypothetical protein
MLNTIESGIINIKELGVNEPARGSYEFNTEKFIPKSLFEKYKNVISWPAPTDKIEMFNRMAVELTILYPQKRKELNLPEDINDFLIERTLYAKLHDLKVLYPEIMDERHRDLFPGRITYFAYKEMISRRMSRNMNIWECFMIYPEQVHDLVTIPGIMDELQDDIHKSKEENDWSQFLLDATALKLLQPDKKISLSDSDWRQTEELLLFMRSSDRLEKQLPFYAARAKIIAANNVVMTNKGLVLTMPGSGISLDNTLAVPERRRF